MRQELHNILVSVDEKGQWEFPKNFRWSKKMNLLNDIQMEFESIFGFQLDIDKNVQDASFTTDLGLLDDEFYDRETGTGVLRYIFSFRFSNFGDLYTVMGLNHSKNTYSKEITECNKQLKKKGFILINEHELDETYDGVNEPYEPNLTWWTRYFDYL